MKNIFIVSAKRTAFGAFGGTLKVIKRIFLLFSLLSSLSIFSPANLYFFYLSIFFPS